MKLAWFVIAILIISVIPASFAQTITIQTNKDQFSGGDTVEINGSVQDGNSGDFVALEIKDPEGETILIRTVTLGQDGSFYLKFKIPESSKSGSYDIVANTQRDGKTITETKTIQQSNPTSTPENYSEGGGCLIVTATYGSELAPQVQMLREIRDNQLLNSASSISFMTGFNQLYYSFSPTIADLERENPFFKETVKIVITPMLNSLSILQYVDMDSEAQVLGYGISMIILNLGMYFGIPVFTIIGIRKRLS